MKDKTLNKHSQAFFEALCTHIGEDPTREGISDTPSRMIQSLSRMLNGYNVEPKEALGAVFKGDIYDEMIVLKKLPFYSMCEHHLLPFFGTLSIGYIPNQYFAGISGLARLAEIFTHRLQIQERLTSEIAFYIDKELKPKGVMVVCEARHLCLEMRDRQGQSPIVTSALLGLFKKSMRTRLEFMQLIKR